MGEAAIIPEGLACCLGQRVVLLRPNQKEVNSRYLLYSLLSNQVQNQIRMHDNTGATVSNLRIPALKALLLSIPPRPQQEAIAEILGALDDKIELNRKMNATLDELGRTIFRSWFVDFDPVRAKMEGREPLGMNAATAALFPDRLVESPLGPIPEGWEVKLFSELCSTQYGYTASATGEETGYKLLRVTDINKANWIDWSSVPNCVVEGGKYPRYALERGDVVVARMADPGKSAMIEENVSAVFASYLVRLKFKNLVWSHFGFGFLKSDLYGAYTEGAKSGSVQANMNAKVIVGARLAVPSESIAKAYLDLIAPFRELLVENLKESRTLAELRDTLLPELISGQIRMPDAERLVGEAVP